MNDEVYYRLAKVLDTLPNGFPSTDSGSKGSAPRNFSKKNGRHP